MKEKRMKKKEGEKDGAIVVFDRSGSIKAVLSSHDHYSISVTWLTCLFFLWMNGWMDGWINEQMDGWMDRWMDG